MVPILESLKQFPAAYVVWKVSDQVIVYANDFALDAFGADENLSGVVLCFGRVYFFWIFGPGTGVGLIWGWVGLSSPPLVFLSR